MTKSSEKAKLVQTKRALSEKYERLARTAKSTPKRKTYLFHAARFRRQAEQLSRQ